MNWDSALEDFKVFIRLEKSLSENSLGAYLSDVEKFRSFMEVHYTGVKPADVELQHLREFLNWLSSHGIGARSQARIISGIRAFFKSLLLNDAIASDPTKLLDLPRLGRKLPQVLSVHEIEKMLESIDMSKPLASRNKAIIEIMYGCGLRVSEVVQLKITDLRLKQGFVKITGKGEKQRLVPIGSKAAHRVELYLEERKDFRPVKGHEDTLFLNRRGGGLTRVTIFNIVKDLAGGAGINKAISPHTFRHSFATHLIDGGADLRAVQEMLGHESILTTEIYTHLDRDYLRDVIIRFHPRS